jgi:hypothetical protein
MTKKEKQKQQAFRRNGREEWRREEEEEEKECRRERESRDDQELSGELSVRYGTVLFGMVPYGTGQLWLSCPILSIGPTTINARAVLSLYSQSSTSPPSLSPSPTLMAPVTLLARFKSLYSKDQGTCCEYLPTSLTVQISPCCPSTQPPCSRYVLFVLNVDPSNPSRLVHISAVLLSPTPSLPC